MLNNGPPEQAFAKTLRYLANDWGHLTSEELARFLCEFCQSNLEINAFCRTIALHFRAERGGKRSKSGRDKQWTHNRLCDLAVDFVTCEITHPKKNQKAEFVTSLQRKVRDGRGLVLGHSERGCRRPLQVCHFIDTSCDCLFRTTRSRSEKRAS